MTGQSANAQLVTTCATAPQMLQERSVRSMRSVRMSGAELYAANDEIRFRLGYRLAKRIMDVMGALALAMVFAPVMLFVLYALRRSGGPVIFSHGRVGQSGRRFQVYKFRTMVTDADKVLENILASDPVARAEWARDQKLKEDPRITPIGRFLRKTSLDELPQLWNVLKGDMSLVGPRPIVTDELPKYGRALRYYLAVKPGITGLWQVTGRNDTDYRRRVALDRRYAQCANVWMDFNVIMKTVGVVLFRRGAY